MSNLSFQQKENRCPESTDCTCGKPHKMYKCIICGTPRCPWHELTYGGWCILPNSTVTIKGRGCKKGQLSFSFER